jgi:hypothetical protein
MSEARLVIPWWRLLIYLAFVIGVAFALNAMLRELFVSQAWLMETDTRGRTPLWIASLLLSLLAAKLLGRVFPLVPERK